MAEFDPYLQQRRLLWHNRVQQWRAQPEETLFHALALAVTLGLLLWLLNSQSAALAAGLRVLWVSYPWELAWALALASGLDQHGLARRLRQQAQHDWLAAQPISDRPRRAQWRRQALFRLGVFATLVLVAAALARAEFATAGLSLAALTLGAAMGGASGRRLRPGLSRRRAARETPLPPRGLGRLWRWQWIEARASLAPRRLAWLLLVILLVPRGGPRMALIALVLVAAAALISAWQRSLTVLPQAQRWLAEQPLRPNHWLGQCLPLPLAVLTAGCLPLALLAWTLPSATLAGIALVLLPALALLSWAVCAAHRAQPRRIGLALAIHVLVLAAVLQSMAPLALPLWLAQIAYLLHRAFR